MADGGPPAGDDQGYPKPEPATDNAVDGLGKLFNIDNKQSLASANLALTAVEFVRIQGLVPGLDPTLTLPTPSESFYTEQAESQTT